MKLLIVEDEKIIRSGLVRHLPWEKMEITEIHAVGNAQEAFQVCENIRPDIVLSDIRMPGMNGVEMCQELQHRYPELQVIFLTGYVEKEYLKAAIDLNAVSYIEKPIALPEVQKAIYRAVENIRKERIRKEAELHRILMSGTEAGKSLGEIDWCQVFLVRLQERESMHVVRQRINQWELFFQKSHLLKLTDVISPKTLALLVASRSGESGGNSIEKHLPFLLKSLEKCGIGNWFLAAGQKGKGSEDIPVSYQTAKEALKALAWKNWNCCVCYPLEQREYRPTEKERHILEEFEQKILHRQSSEAVKIVEDFYCQLIQEKTVLSYPVLHLTDEFWRVLMKNRQSLSRGRNVNKNGDENMFFPEEASTLKELSSMLRKSIVIQMTDNGKKEDSEEDRNCFVVQKVVDYMRKNYQDADLSIRTLADYVYLTPTYLSNLFKKQTGCTIGQYLTDLRIDEAKKRLRDPQYKLYQIAERSGYRDPNYFARIFKKKTGYTPSEYREKGC